MRVVVDGTGAGVGAAVPDGEGTGVLAREALARAPGKALRMAGSQTGPVRGWAIRTEPGPGC